MPVQNAVNRRALLALFAASGWRVGQSAPLTSSSAASQTKASASERQRIEVGPDRPVKTIGAAAVLARDGALIEVDAGDYRGDIAVWTQNDLSLLAVGGRVRLIADGRSAEGKAIWVVRAERMSVQGFDFTGAAVPDRNGAGIRLESGSLRVGDCAFTHNEYGILTGNQTDTVLEVEDSEFGYNGSKDHYFHNLYVGTIARLTITGSYLHHAYRGHLLKSRAATSYVAYNRITDEHDGNASYELEFPSGGVAYVIGNVIQQSPLSENVHLISVGAEGYKWTSNELYLVNNTLIDNVPQGGVFLRVSPGADAVRVINNLLVGKGTWDIGVAAIFRNNPLVEAAEFAGLAKGDFHLKASSRARGKATDAGFVNGVPLQPSREYVHPRHTVPIAALPIQPGAMQSLATKY